MPSTREPLPSREPQGRTAFVVAGVLLSLLHIGLSFLIAFHLPFSPPRPFTSSDRRLQYLLFVLHPYSAIQCWLIPLPPAIAIVAFFSESILWGFGIAWALRWLRWTLSRQGGN